jgi:phosphoglycolate phosphatase
MLNFILKSMIRKEGCMNRYSVCLFDLDGTIADSSRGITEAALYALNKMDKRIIDKKELLKFIGPPLDYSFMNFYGMDRDDAAKAITFYREYYGKKGVMENEIYPGIEEMLAALKSAGIKLILATSKPEVFAKQILAQLGLERYFDAAVGGNLDGSRTKKAEVIEYAAENYILPWFKENHSTGTELYHIENNDGNKALTKEKIMRLCIMAGDREFDIWGAKAAKMDSIGVLYGFGNVKELTDAGADYLVKEPMDICRILIN